MRVRSFRRGDEAALADICVRTAAAGGDARGRYRSDALMGDLFALPYAALEPELAHVLDDDGVPVGYVVGTADTARFVQRYRAEWIPAVAGRYPVVRAPATGPDEEMLLLHQHPERMLLPVIEDHPAHLHIDLLPQAQGRGWGRRLMDAFLERLREQRVRGVHLTMLRENVAARGFYDRLGFAELPLPEEPGLALLARDTRPLA